MEENFFEFIHFEYHVFSKGIYDVYIDTRGFVKIYKNGKLHDMRTPNRDKDIFILGKRYSIGRLIYQTVYDLHFDPSKIVYRLGRTNDINSLVLLTKNEICNINRAECVWVVKHICTGQCKVIYKKNLENLPGELVEELTKGNFTKKQYEYLQIFKISKKKKLKQRHKRIYAYEK